MLGAWLVEVVAGRMLDFQGRLMGKKIPTAGRGVCPVGRDDHLSPSMGLLHAHLVTWTAGTGRHFRSIRSGSPSDIRAANQMRSPEKQR